MKLKRRESNRELGPDDVAGVQRRNLADALFKATARCRFQRVKFLLDNGVSPLVVNDDGQNILMAALYVPDDAKRDTMFQYLARRGADCCFVDKKTGKDVTAWAAYLGRAQQVESIFDFVVGEVDLHAKDQEGMTPLHHAVTTGHVEVVNVLVKNMQKYDLSLDVPDDHGLTPYIYARRLGYGHIAEALVEGGCSTEQFDIRTFRSADQWAEIGRKERQKKFNKELAMEKAGLISRTRAPVKSMKLPALKLTSSDNKKAVLINLPEASFIYKKKRPSRSRRSSSDSNLTSSTTMRLREDTSLLLSIASSSTNSLNKQSISDNVCNIMDMVAQQCCHTFRKSVRPPTPEKVSKKNPFSSLAFVLRTGKKQKGKEQMMQHKQGHNMTTVMSAFSASKNIASDYNEKKKKRLLPPITG